jgi:hypothetical protein
MSTLKVFRVNSNDIVSDLVEDELIIVDLKSGAYYSLDGVGAFVWSCLEGGMDVPATIRSVAAAYAGAESEIAEVVERLVAELAADNLIVAVTPDSGQAPISASALVPPSSEKKSFVAPVLHKYTDMQELLLVDPIHDVDDQGWPILKKENPAKG